jgi:hypothetical protein
MFAHREGDSTIWFVKMQTENSCKPSGPWFESALGSQTIRGLANEWLAPFALIGDSLPTFPLTYKTLLSYASSTKKQYLIKNGGDLMDKLLFTKCLIENCLILQPSKSNALSMNYQ